MGSVSNIDQLLKHMLSLFRFPRNVVPLKISRFITSCQHFTNESYILETWKVIDGFSLYEISSYGNVRNLKRGKLLSINNDRFKRLNAQSRISIKSDSGKYVSLGVGRLVLSYFAPRDDAETLFAVHIDQNPFNNKLENLQWSNTRRIYKSKTSNVEVKLRNIASGTTMCFASLAKCHQYLSTLSIRAVGRTVSKYCVQRKIKHGYQFEFLDQTKYRAKIPDLDREEWKQFYETPHHNTVYYISSFGRSKRVQKNGRESLNSPFLVNGYHFLRGAKIGKNPRSVARLVALHFVDNPNNYTMVDHIDCNRINNQASNLRWVKDQRHNAMNPISRQRFSEAKQFKHKIQQLSLDGSLLKEWDRPIHIKRSFGFQTGHILSVCRGTRKTAYRYKWRFVDFETSRQHNTSIDFR
eukprot:62651_1